MHSPSPLSALNVQSKRDLQAAEDYYSRAVVADPSDGEMISEYANLVWELHHDQEKASFLFEQAVQATPGDRYSFGEHFYKMLLVNMSIMLKYRREKSIGN